MDFDVLIIGGGPAGCAAARDIAAAGYRVLVIEEHSTIGEPLQCAGLISERTLRLSRVSPQVVLHRIKGARVHSPGGRELRLDGSKVYALAVDRVAFDRYLAAQASEKGAIILSSARAVGINALPGGVKVLVQERAKHSSIQQKQRERYITGRLVIGADGPDSLVSRWLGIGPAAEGIPMYAAEVELPARPDMLIDVFFGSRIAPGWFAWVFPTEKGRARIGIGSGLKGGPRLQELLRSLVELNPGLFRGMRIIRGTGGIVPIGFKAKTYGPHALLVGDAAGHVKPISGGGLYLGLEAARLCAATAVDSLKQENYTEDFLASYQYAWEKRFGSEIKVGLQHREAFLGMSDQEIDAIIASLDKPLWRKLILMHADLDYHSHLASRLALAPSWAKRFVLNGLESVPR